MNTPSVLLKVSLSLLLLAGSTACGLSVEGPKQTGQLAFRVQWPGEKSNPFVLKAIPAGTRSLEIHISGEGLTIPRVIRLTAEPGRREVTHRIASLPTGNKQVKVSALDAEKVLATAVKPVFIEAAKTTQAEFDLQSALFPLVLKLPQSLPFEIQVQAHFKGESTIREGFSRSGRFPAGVDTLTLSDLPAGDLEMALVFRFKLANEELESAPVRKTMTGKAGERVTVNLGLPELANALLPTLLKLNPSDVQALIRYLPEEFLELLRKNAVLAALLQTAPQPSAVPSVAPTPEPTAPPTVQVPQLEILDSRVVLRPIQILRETAQTLISATDPQVIPLQNDILNSFALNTQVHAAVVRLHFNGDTKPVVNMRIENLEDPTASINFRTFPSALTEKNALPDRYIALILLMKDDGTPPVLDQAGLYRVTLTAIANQGQPNEMRREIQYRVQVNGG